MAKHIVFDYEFDASARTVVLEGIYAQKRLLLITNTNDNELIYSFTDPSKGLTDISFNYDTSQTTLTLAYDTTSMADTDPLQIFVELDVQTFQPTEVYTDPVSKFRVSNPENLIDTDFEYGLQSTKWETLELTKNIPTFFARNGDFELEVTSITATQGSNLITVTTGASHGLQRGSPVIVIGTSNILADGGFVVASRIDDTTFTYKCKGNQPLSGSIKETYTQVFPGSVYSSTEFKLTNTGAITTNAASPVSELTVNTIDPTAFENDTSVTLSNTFAKANITFDTDDVKIANSVTLTGSYTNATPTGESDAFLLGGVDPFNWRPLRGHYFGYDEFSVDTATDYITFTQPHNFINNEPVVIINNPYVSQTLQGVSNMRGYHAFVVDEFTIQLRYYYYSSSRPNVSKLSFDPLSSTKMCIASAEYIFSTSGGRSDFVQIYANSSWRPRFNNGWLSEFTNNNTRFFNAYWWADGFVNNFTNFVTNPITQWNTLYDYYVSYYGNFNYLRYRNTFNGGYINLNSDGSDYFIVPIEQSDSATRNSLYFQNHGLENDDVILLTATQGNLPSGLSSGSFYRVSVVDANRIRLRNTTGSFIDFQNGGSTNLIYSFTCTKQLIDANTVSIANNELNDGDPIVYNADGGTVIGGLSDGTTYYVSNKIGDVFNLSTQANALVSTVQIPNQRSSFYVDLSNNDLTNITHNFTTGDAVLYTATFPIVGLKSGAFYYVRSINSLQFSLHPSAADAIANTNKVDLVYYSDSSASGTFAKYTVIDLTSVPATSEAQKFAAAFVGAADGVYSVSGTAADQKSFNISNNLEILPREYEKTSQDIFCPTLDGFYDPDHGFITGDEVVLTLTGTTGVSGVTSGNTYYIIANSKDFYQLALSEANAQQKLAIALTDSGSSSTERTGTIKFDISSIVGSFAGAGTVSFDAGSTHVEGLGTLFTSFFNSGDTFYLNVPIASTRTQITSFSSASDYFIASSHNLTDGDAVYFDLNSGGSLPTNILAGKVYFVNTSTTGDANNRFSVYYTETDATANTNKIQLTNAGSSCFVNSIADQGDTIERVIDYVNSDSLITTKTPLPAVAQTETNYMLRTQVLLRADGFALHRPYDGGVELVPSTNPDSQMIRQTRKYFRYQSGKGIQVSFAVNFSPTSQIDTFSHNGSTGIISTRYPHRLSTGIAVNVSGSTNQKDTIGTKTYSVTVSSDINGANYFAITGVDERATLELLEGRTYRFDMSDATTSTHPLRFSETADGTHGGGTEYTTGVTDNYATNAPGTAGSYIEITVATGAPTLYAYCENHSGMGWQADTPVDPDNNQANLWNGQHLVTNIVDNVTFEVALDGTPSNVEATGLVEYNVDGWTRSSLKCGLFDDQNGIFFEYDGSQLYVARRSSIQQISGYCSATFRSGTITGVDTKFSSQLSVGDYIVLKGQTHLITRIDSDTLMYVSPSYRGVNNDKIIGTIVKTTKIPQSQWNLDKCDGTGKSGFKLDIHKIQMAYVDYSWYGAGKVRFGFKDQNGDVKYVHQLVHGNFFTEAYMRSGNIPARYEIQNDGKPSYVPALAHWGTSVIMDGRFDSDKAYLFNAASNNLTLLGANTSSLTVSARVETLLTYQQQFANQYYIGLGYALLLQNGSSLYSSIVAGTSITGAGLSGSTVASNPTGNNSSIVRPQAPYIPDSTTRYGGQNSTKDTRALLLIDKAPQTTSGSFSNYVIGASGGGDPTREIPLISVRLAPSVDTSTPGLLGEREIINRMQLILNEVSILSTHTAEISLILNGQLSNNDWQRVTNPSLSQLIVHSTADSISNGASIFNFRAAGDTGTSRVQQQTSATLGEVATLGNSILGGDNVFPDGPDVLTVVAKLSEDPSTVDNTTPFIISGRISWAESQA